MITKIPELHTRMLPEIDDYDAKLYPYLMDSLSRLNRGRVVRDYDSLMPNLNRDVFRAIINYYLKVAYIDGRFYNLSGFGIDKQKHGKMYIYSGYELVKINQIPILEFVSQNQLNYSDCNRWDVNNKIFYNRDVTLTNSLVSFDLYDKITNNRDLTLTFINKSGKELSVKYAATDRNFRPIKRFDEFSKAKWRWIDKCPDLRNKVIYFDSVLYVKMVEMDSLDFFKEKLSKYNDMPLKRVVIDVRNNGGGSDDVWSGVLSMIIDTTLCRRGKIAVSNSDIYRHNPLLLSPYIGACSFDSLDICKDTIINEEYRLLSDGIDCMEIVPDSSSLRYKGQIYILHNRGSFSSSTAFLTFALGEERVVAVGEHNGCLGGYGVSPFVFQLPYSKLAFVMHSTIHIPDNAKSVEDYFWNKTEVEVTTTPEWEALMYLDVDLFTPEILKTKDPFFKKVMELR